MICAYKTQAHEVASLVHSLQSLTTRRWSSRLTKWLLLCILYNRLRTTRRWSLKCQGFPRRCFWCSEVILALTMQAIGCASSFTSGAPLIGMRGSRSPYKPRARNLSTRGSLALPGEDECSTVDYNDFATQWLSADFLDLRLRSSGLICNEAIHALRNHFQKKDEQSTTTGMPSNSGLQSLEVEAPAAYQGNLPRPLPNVIVLDEAYFSQLYNCSSTFVPMTTCSFLDESFC